MTLWEVVAVAFALWILWTADGWLRRDGNEND